MYKIIRTIVHYVFVITVSISIGWNSRFLFDHPSDEPTKLCYTLEELEIRDNIYCNIGMIGTINYYLTKDRSDKDLPDCDFRHKVK